MKKRIDYSNINCVEQLNEEFHLVPANIEEEKKLSQKEKDKADDPNKVVNPDKFDVVYADQKLKEFKNIFKHIIVFTNDRDPKNNKTLQNIMEAIDTLKKKHAPK